MSYAVVNVRAYGASPPSWQLSLALGNLAKTLVTPACSLCCNKTSYLRRLIRLLEPEKTSILG